LRTKNLKKGSAMQIRYTVQPKDTEVRRNEIAMRAEEARKNHSFRKEFKFRGGKEMLPVITLPVDYLIYRLENYRTGDKQLSLVATGKVEPGFFSPAHREDTAVQQKQHEILVEHARTGSGETIKPIYDELARVAEQTEDLIISADGVVVNGNRRLSAMRELLREPDGERFRSFANVVCAVLPDSATAKEILQLEIGLQMQPETKLPYEWTALGRAVRDLREQGMNDDEIAEIMNRDKSDIVRAAKMIDAADIYLTDWLEKPNDFDELEETEQAFKQIATRNIGKTDNVSVREITRKFDFFVVEQRENLTDRAYVFVNAIEDNPVLFLDTVAAELEIELPNAPPAIGTQHKISFDDEQPTIQKDYRVLAAKLEEIRANDDEAIATIKRVESVCRIVAEQGKNLDKAALRFAKNAEKALLAVDLQTGNPNTYSEIDSILSKCIEIANRLKGEVATRLAR
jgi:hypothetical protein